MSHTVSELQIWGAEPGHSWGGRSRGQVLLYLTFRWVHHCALTVCVKRASASSSWSSDSWRFCCRSTSRLLSLSSSSPQNQKLVYMLFPSECCSVLGDSGLLLPLLFLSLLLSCLKYKNYNLTECSQTNLESQEFEGISGRATRTIRIVGRVPKYHSECPMKLEFQIKT